MNSEEQGVYRNQNQTNLSANLGSAESDNPFNQGRPKLHHYKKSGRRLKATNLKRPIT
jgi:hypothetical protein